MSVTLLIKFPHGLGDVVQFSVVLKHLQRYRPGWEVDVRVGRGKHTALRGLCRRVYHDHESCPDDSSYTSAVTLGWYENYCNYPDRPNSKITNCLREVFGLDYDPALGRYDVARDQQAKERVLRWLRYIDCRGRKCGTKCNVVVLHYRGNTSPHKKNLDHWHAQSLCDLIRKAGRVPVILDWDQRTPEAFFAEQGVFTPPSDLWGDFGSGDAAMIGELIGLAEAFIGIDSGPGKIASATDTPSLICWRGHHPIQFHDPAPNTTHLVPAKHMDLPPCAGQPLILDYFLRHYQHMTYAGDHDMATVARRWLARQLGFQEEPSQEQGKTFVLPCGIGDCMWALLKLRSVAKQYSQDGLDVIVSGNPTNHIDQRALPFLRRFGFVRQATLLDVPIHVDRDHLNDDRGRYRYQPDGVQGNYHYLVPNTVLESGRRIEEWLPEHPVDWDVLRDFNWERTERGDEVGRNLHPFVVFYLGPESGHTDEGHNRGWLWEPKEWIALGQAMADQGMRVVVTGASYDRSFWERYVRPGVQEAKLAWIDLIGQLEIGETLAMLRHAHCLISYQCGLGIVAHYLGVPVVMWWRPDGNSLHPGRLVAFDERMRDAWIRPGWEDRYLGLVYRRETVAQISVEIEQRGWLREKSKAAPVASGESGLSIAALSSV